MCRGHSRTRMYYKKKAFASLFIRLSSFLMFASFFWHFSSVFLSFSCSPRRRPYRYSLILEPQYFLSVPCLLHCLVCVSDGRRERERARRWGGCTTMRNAYVYVRADRLYFLSIYDDDENAENARAPLLPVYFESIRRFFLVPPSSGSCLMLRFFSLGIIEQRKKNAGA